MLFNSRYQLLFNIRYKVKTYYFIAQLLFFNCSIITADKAAVSVLKRDWPKEILS